MGKKSRAKNKTATPSTDADAVGPRQPCPCGSGRRYKACHGAAGGPPATLVKRPFADLPDEVDVVAVREFVSCASAPVTLKDSDRSVLLCSMLPGALPALVREDGQIWLGLQVRHAFGDPSRDLGAVLLKALEAEPGEMVGLITNPGEGPRLQDLLTNDQIAFTVHEGFEFWLGDTDEDEAIQAGLEQANASVSPAARISAGAYWTRMGDREYLRWVLPHDEDTLLDALARLQAGGQAHLVDGDRLIGTFRTQGLLAPVWEFDAGTGPEGLAAALDKLSAHLDEALNSSAPLTSAERSAKAGLTSRALTIR